MHRRPLLQAEQWAWVRMSITTIIRTAATAIQTTATLASLTHATAALQVLLQTATTTTIAEVRRLTGSRSGVKMRAIAAVCLRP